MDKDSLSHTSWDCACHVVWIPKYRRKVPCGETRREVGETPGMPAGQTGGVEMVEGSACPDHTRICLRIAPKQRATWWVGRGVRARSYRASGTMSGDPCGQGPDDVGEGLLREHRRP